LIEALKRRTGNRKQKCATQQQPAKASVAGNIKITCGPVTGCGKFGFLKVKFVTPQLKTDKDG
jgi:hypothetical protein